MAENQKGGEGFGLIILGAAGVAAYFLLQKKGFVILKVLEIPALAKAGNIISPTIFGENKGKVTQKCFIKLIDRETTQLLAPIQTADVGPEASQQFTFQFTMPNKILDLQVQTGRIINNVEKIDDKKAFTIKLSIIEGSEIVDWYLST
jgi:hypothetical protein